MRPDAAPASRNLRENQLTASIDSVSALPAGDFAEARSHLERALELYDPGEHKSPAFVYAFDPRVVCLDYLARALLPLGFPQRGRPPTRRRSMRRDASRIRIAWRCRSSSAGCFARFWATEPVSRRCPWSWRG